MRGFEVVWLFVVAAAVEVRERVPVAGPGQAPGEAHRGREHRQRRMLEGGSYDSEMGGIGIGSLSVPPRLSCYSCASFAYLPLWNQLMHHYFPPRNFTDRCWQPDDSIGMVPCSTACFTMVEKIDPHDQSAKLVCLRCIPEKECLENFLGEQRGVLRGCVDRLLLFGLDQDVRDALGSGHERICRDTDRKILRLYPLSDENDLVKMCTCVGPTCNSEDMLFALSAAHRSIHYLAPLIGLIYLIRY